MPGGAVHYSTTMGWERVLVGICSIIHKSTVPDDKSSISFARKLETRGGHVIDKRWIDLMQGYIHVNDTEYALGQIAPPSSLLYHG